MIRLAIAITGCVLIAGCANHDSGAPMYLGGLASEAEAKQHEARPEQPAAIKHVKSSRVLGAMAFEKVTGMSVEPSRLAD